MNSTTQDTFRVDLPSYRGPMDLLLYLVRRSEVAIDELSINKIAEQYVQFIEAAAEIDFNLVGDFLEVASILVESKMRAILPRGDHESADTDDDPRSNLVQRLLLYKQFKDVAVLLEEQSCLWQNRIPRIADDLPSRKLDIAEQPIHEIELWDLVSSFGRVLRNSKASEAANIVYDDTPVHVHMRVIHDQLCQQGQLNFFDLFQPGMHKSAMVGLFLAILELVRHHGVRTEQLDGDIRIFQGEEFQRDSRFDESVGY